VATAQDKGTLNPQPLPPLAKPDDPATPAKELFGRKTAPASLQARTIGFYSKGCLAGAVALPINRATWQGMRLSRNRNWGHPNLVQFLERLAAQAPKTGWHGLLVGDMSQPRGGPMITGHASHQVGLDADIWLTPMPNRELTRQEREEMSATMIVAEDRRGGSPGRRPAGVDAGAPGRDQGGGKGPAGRPHLRERGDQESLVPRRRQRPPLARQGAAVVGTRLSLSRSARLPVRQHGMQAAAGAAGGRRLRRGARGLVHRRRAPPEALAAGGAHVPADDGRSAGRLQPGSGR